MWLNTTIYIARVYASTHSDLSKRTTIASNDHGSMLYSLKLQ